MMEEDKVREEGGYLFVCMDENAKEEGVELPLEDDGTMLLSVLQSQFNGSSGLKYRNPLTGTWRGIKLVDGLLRPPNKGWGESVYIVVTAPSKAPGGSQHPEEVALDERGEGEKLEELSCEGDFSSLGYSSDSYKRKLEDSEGQRASKNPRSQSPDNYPKPASPAFGQAYRNQEDLIILGLEWSVTDQELRSYFQQFGEVAHCEVKKDLGTGKSRGFGFVRYGDRAIQANVFKASHTIKGRRVELKYPKQSISHLPSKLFVGCLPLKPEVNNHELTEYFSQFGRLNDVYIPRPYRGFGFVTFTDPAVAQKVVGMRNHTIHKSNLNVSFADPKGSGSKMTQFPTDPFGIPLSYPTHMSRLPGAPQATSPRYAFSGQPQQAYTMAYGAAPHVAAIPRPENSQNPTAMGSVHAVPVSGTPGLQPQTSAGLYAVSYGNGTQQQQQQSPYARQSPGAYR